MKTKITLEYPGKKPVVIFLTQAELVVENEIRQISYAQSRRKAVTISGYVSEADLVKTDLEFLEDNFEYKKIKVDKQNKSN